MSSAAKSIEGSGGVAVGTFQVTLLYFAWLRERTGTSEEVLALPAHVTDVAGLIDFLVTRGPGYVTAFSSRSTVRCAVNQDFADPGTPVRAGDEVAFFPPVTGG